MSRRCLVTGGAGFIGSHIVGEALARGWEVTVLDNLCTGKLGNLKDYGDNVEFIKGDIRDREAVLRAAKGAEVVFHLAALVSVPESIQKPLSSAEINDIGTLNVMDAAREAGVRRVVYSSSCAVYGNNFQQPHSEDCGFGPASPYAAHKLLGEHYGSFFTDVHGLEVVALRYFNVFGPRQDPSSPYSGVISIFLDRLSSGEVPIIFGDGEQTRDFIYVSDVVRANMLASEAQGAAGRAYNVGTGSSTSINALLSTLAAVLGVQGAPEYRAARAGEILHSRADTRLALKMLGFEAKTAMKDGLAKTAEWFRR